MLLTVILLSITCGIVQSSGVHPAAPVGVAPIVTAASSQYFERTFNRLVAAPPALEPVPFVPAPVAPVIPIAPPIRPILSVLPLAPAPPVAVDATRTVPQHTHSAIPIPNTPADPNVAIAIATAHAAAPVATILLPPYPFGLPPSFGVFPQAPQQPDVNTKESTTLKTTTTVQATTTQREEATTPVPSNIDNSFAQALPSNQDVNFRQYLAPQLPSQRPAPQPVPVPRPQQVPQHLPLPDSRPLKFKTNVEVVPVPLAYIAPPSPHQHHHHHHHHHHHQSLKVPHIHTFIPKTSKIIIRPITTPLRIRTVRIPAGFSTYGPPKLVKRVALKHPQNIRTIPRETEPTTFKPINRPLNKPPRL